MAYQWKKGEVKGDCPYRYHCWEFSVWWDNDINHKYSKYIVL